MSATTVGPTREELAAASRGWAGRLSAALPLGTIFIWLCLVYGWQSWRHGTPWLFTDELENAQISRSIAATGHGGRRGEPYGFQTLYNFLVAPAWWIDDTAGAYSAAKYIGVLTMTSAVFPAYALARMLVSRPAALFAAAASAAIPAFAYSSFLLEEALAYPYAILCLFLVTKALATRSRNFIVAAAVASLVAPLVRQELSVIVLVYALGGLWLAWRSERARRWRSGWSRGDWIGAIALAAGALVLWNAVLGHLSASWLVSTGQFKVRMVEYGLWAAGALTVGLGVLPVVAGLAALVRPRSEPRTAELRAFVAVTVSSVVAFGLYTAIKAAFLSTVFATRIEERNLIYVAPLLFVGTALWLERRRLLLAPLAAAAGLAVYLIVATPYQLQFHFYSDAPGLSILQMANRNLAFTEGIAQWTMLAVLGVAILLLLAPRLLRRGPAVRAALVLAAVLVLAWNVAGEISAGKGASAFSRNLLANFPRQKDWLDRATGGQPALYVGQKITDPNGIWLVEFWNRSLRYVWSLDGTAPGPGPVLTPNLGGPDGSLVPAPDVRYVVADTGVNLVGRVIERRSHWRLYEIERPLRLSDAPTGIFSDGWTGADSAYSQFETPGDEPGWALVNVARTAWNGPDRPGKVTITVGRLISGRDHEPHMGKVTRVAHWVVHSGGHKLFAIPTPPPPIRVEVHVSPTFSPSDFGLSDARQLGAQVSYGFTTRRPGKAPA